MQSDWDRVWRDVFGAPECCAGRRLCAKPFAFPLEKHFCTLMGFLVEDGGRGGTEGKGPHSVAEMR